MTIVVNKPPAGARLPIPRLKPGRHYEPTKEHVIGLWAYMAQKHDVRIVQKKDDDMMKVVAEVLGLLNVIDKNTFMTRFSTILPIKPWRAVYIPFEPGVENEYYSLWGQICTCAHEFDHQLQCDKEGEFKYASKYLTSVADRVHWETGGYRTRLELEWYYQGNIPDILKLTAPLVNYGLNQANINVANRMLALSIPIVRAGGIVETSTKEVIEWLNKQIGA